MYRVMRDPETMAAECVAAVMCGGLAECDSLPKMAPAGTLDVATLRSLQARSQCWDVRGHKYGLYTYVLITNATGQHPMALVLQVAVGGGPTAVEFAQQYLITDAARLERYCKEHGIAVLVL